MTEHPPSSVSPATPVEAVRSQKTYGTAFIVTLINLGLFVLIGAGLYLWRVNSLEMLPEGKVRACPRSAPFLGLFPVV